MDTMTEALALAERRWTADRDRSVMVALCGGYPEKHRRVVKMRHDDGGLYVRLGKRAMVKRYLKDMAGARIVDRPRKLVVFYEVK